MTAKTEQVQPVVQLMQPERPPVAASWVMAMHEHYYREGFYRSEDVSRVLGDPGQCVTIPVHNWQSVIANALKP